MRTVTPSRLLLLSAVLLAAACDDSPSPHEPPAVEEDAPVREGDAPDEDQPSLLDDQSHWADGYLLDGSPLRDSVDLTGGHFSFNRSGGATIVTKPAGTTGRYIVTFKGLSALLGGKSTVHVNHYGFDSDTYCKPAGAYLVSDKIEVRCFKTSTRAAADASFILLAAAGRADRAFAFAHQPTASDYSPNAQGSWNPAPGGASRVFRSGVGKYRVVFKGLGSQLPSSVAGHVQVTAVGTSKAHCKPQAFGGTPDLEVSVRCFTPAGSLVDTKFAVLFLRPAAHLAYAWGDQPTTDSYTPYFMYASNPGTGGVYITRNGVGKYTVTWQGVDPEIIDGGNVQATAYGTGNAQCKAVDVMSEGAVVQCFTPKGTPVDSYYMVLFGS